MSEQYNIDLRSKSDAQIAECIIKHELEAQDIECTRLRLSNVAQPTIINAQSTLHSKTKAKGIS